MAPLNVHKTKRLDSKALIARSLRTCHDRPSPTPGHAAPAAGEWSKNCRKAKEVSRPPEKPACARARDDPHRRKTTPIALGTATAPTRPKRANLTQHQARNRAGGYGPLSSEWNPTTRILAQRASTDSLARPGCCRRLRRRLSSLRMYSGFPRNTARTNW